MLKKWGAAVVLLCVGSVCLASFIDNEDPVIFYVLGGRLERVIAKKYFPEIRNKFPIGLSRKEAWTQDVKKAAAGLWIRQKKIDELIAFVLDPVDRGVVTAPHKKLLEFELYGKGKRELAGERVWGTYKTMPPSWKKLLELPVDQRRYTTIPVLRGFASYRKYRGGTAAENEQTLFKLLESQKQGCVDTQGCILDMIGDLARNPREYADWAAAYRMLLRKEHTDHKGLDLLDEARTKYWRGEYWRSDRKMDIIPFLPRTLSKSFVQTLKYRWQGCVDLKWALYTEKEERLVKMCQTDPVMRDVIVTHGLTNREMPVVRKVAWKFYKESFINYPTAAVKLPQKEAVALLQDHPEYHYLRDLLLIREMKGQERIDAIDRYLAKYPDQVVESFGKNYIVTSDSIELNALAGAELFQMGRPYEAAERWVRGCVSEDIALVAEQVMSVDELKAFCDKHFSVPVQQEFDHGSALWRYTSEDKQKTFRLELSFLMRNLLARRLMREGRPDEARKYFSGQKTKALAREFFALRRIVHSVTASKEAKVNALLDMADLMRFQGNHLYGTFLDPDNLIYRNNYRTVWGAKQKYVKLKKPALPRFSYRYRAAELYAQAADMAADPRLKAKCLWTAGTVLKNLSPKSADVYFKKLYRIAPELTEKNWFLPIKKAPEELRRFYYRSHFKKK